MTAFARCFLLMLAAWVTLGVHPASAQEVGPLTGRIDTDEPDDASFRIGPVLVASGLSVQRIGIDNNVFDDAENPRRDWHAVLTPNATAYLRSGLMRFTLATEVDFTYYRTYASERSVSRSLRGRADLMFNRLRPFIGGALVESRERPNAEIDLRARRNEREVAGGLIVELTPVTYVFAGATRTDYLVEDDEFYRGVSLAEALDHRSESVALGVRRHLTPLTSVQIVGRVWRDRFSRSPVRDSESRAVQTIWTFAPDALWRGELSAGFQSFQPNDVEVRSFRGLTLGGRIEWPILTSTRLDLDVDRRVRYSFEEADAYFVDTATAVTLTQRVVGQFDVQARGGYRRLAYGNGIAPAGSDPVDRVTSALAGVGYTLSNESRVGFNYEFTNRESERRRDRLFDRHRVFGSWTHKF